MTAKWFRYCRERVTLALTRHRFAGLDLCFRRPLGQFEELTHLSWFPGLPSPQMAFNHTRAGDQCHGRGGYRRRSSDLRIEQVRHDHRERLRAPGTELLASDYNEEFADMATLQPGW